MLEDGEGDEPVRDSDLRVAKLTLKLADLLVGEIGRHRATSGRVASTTPRATASASSAPLRRSALRLLASDDGVADGEEIAGDDVG